MPDVRFTSKQQFDDYSLKNLVDDFGRSSHHVRAADQADGSSRVYTSSKWSLTSLKAALGWTEKLAARETKRNEGGSFVFHLVAKEVGEDAAKAILEDFGNRFETGVRGRDLRDIQAKVQETQRQQFAVVRQVAVQGGKDLIDHFSAGPLDVDQTLDQLGRFLEATGEYEVGDEDVFHGEDPEVRQTRRNVFENVLNETLKDMVPEALQALHAQLQAFISLARGSQRDFQDGLSLHEEVRLNRKQQALNALDSMLVHHLDIEDPAPEQADASLPAATASDGAGTVAQQSAAQAPAPAPRPADLAKALTAQLRHDLGAATSLTRQGELEAQLRMLDTGTLYMDPEIASLSTIYEAKAQAVHPGTLFTAAVSEAQAARAGQDIMDALEHSGLLGQPFRMAIPIHTGNAMNGHWTGAFVSFDPNAAPGIPKMKIQTVDSLSTASSLRPLNPTLQATLAQVFGDPIFGGEPVEFEAVRPKHRQNDGTSCGACTMENLLDLAAGPSAAQPFAANDMLALRLHQVQTLLQAP